MNTAETLSNLRHDLTVKQGVVTSLLRIDAQGAADLVNAQCIRIGFAIEALECRLVREIERAEHAAEAKVQSFTPAMLVSLTAKHAAFAAVREQRAGHWVSDAAHARCLRLTAAISYLEERIERNESK